MTTNSLLAPLLPQGSSVEDDGEPQIPEDIRKFIDEFPDTFEKDLEHGRKLERLVQSRSLKTKAVQYAVEVGRVSATEALLDMRADVALENNENLLHILAGATHVHRCIDYEKLVSLLLDARAALTTTRGQRPLDLALLPGSIFPVEKLYLLFPFCNPRAPAKTLFEDLASVAVKHRSAAREIVKYVVSKMPFSASINAQQFSLRNAEHEDVDLDFAGLNIQDRIAAFIYMAPNVAVTILNLLFEHPYVEDQHTISRFASFYGFPNNYTMRCAYEKGSVPLTEDWDGSSDPHTRVLRPAWLTDDTDGNINTVWQAKLVPEPSMWPQPFRSVLELWRYIYPKRATGECHVGPFKCILSYNVDEVQPLKDSPGVLVDCHRLSYVHECDVKVLHIPEVLDVDIMWAIALAPGDSDLLQELSVHAIVNGMWQLYFCQVYIIDYILSAIDFVLIAAWGLHPKNQFCRWTLMGVAIKDCVLLCSWCYWYHQKYWMRRKGQEYYHKSSMTTTNQKYTMWSLKHFIETRVLLEFVDCVFLVVLLLLATSWASKRELFVPCLVINLVFRGNKLFGLAAGIEFHGQRIIALIKSFFSGSIWEMFFVCLAFYLISFLTMYTLLRKDSISDLAAVFYKGLFLGDGDALGALDMKPTCRAEDESSYAKTLDGTNFLGKCSSVSTFIYDVAGLSFMVVVTFLFSIVIVNLIIAVYSNEYVYQVMLCPLSFMKQRAHMNVRYCLKEKLWTCRCFIWIQPMQFFLRPLTLILTAVSIKFFCFVGHTAWGGPVFGLLIALCELLFHASAYKEVHDPDEDMPQDEWRFLWACFRTKHGVEHVDVLQNCQVCVSDMVNIAQKRNLPEIDSKLEETLAKLAVNVDPIQNSLEECSKLLDQLIAKRSGSEGLVDL